MASQVLNKKEMILDGLSCAHCASEIEEAVGKLDEIKSANLNFVNKRLSFELKESSNEHEVINKVMDKINTIEPGLDIKIKDNLKNNSNKKEMILGGLNCAHCAAEIEEAIEKLDGIVSSNLNFVNKKLIFEFSSNANEKEVLDNIIEKINTIEPGLDIQMKSDKKHSDNGEDSHDHGGGGHNKKELIKLILGVAVYILGIYQTATGNESVVNSVIFVVAYLVIGGDVLLKALRNATKGRVFDENFLMSIATVGALAIGELSEAVGVMLFYKIGEYLQDLAVGKSRKSITALMEIRSDYANLKVGSELKVVSPEDISVGDLIVVKPGEKVPLDGVVVEGSSMIDTSAITGESVLREVSKDEDILSGVINKNALITIKVTKPFGESTVSKILDLVENASSKKAPTENFISKFSKYYTPAVVIIALGVAFIPPLVLPDASLRDWLYRGLIFLVVSCPCALVLSIPLSFFSGIGLASKKGILIKGSNYLEALRDVDTVVFDKTGTLTKGVFKVTKVNSVGISEKQLIEYAALAEANSNHPIAKSITSFYNKKVDLDKIENYEEIAAHGIKIRYSGETIFAGNEKLMKSEKISYTPATDIGTVVYVAVDSEFRGYIVISDEIKDDSVKAIKDLKKAGIKEVVMLTGDNKKVADSIAKKLGLDKVYSNLLPDEKVEKLEEIYKGRAEKERVAFVGDGINDAPVLARADVGIAMGGLGSDAAIEAADVVLMNDEPSKISTAIEIANKTNKIVWQNIAFALGVKVIVMVLGAGGVATMWEAIFADVGVALIAVLNAMRAMK
ncbi:cadmium-translocating P-type ATPase [Clostridioides mangenotii]|uniref:heavy metal translocating P-type ATPase n=1 Tax=Metaclostridioides mangenotii TaxID=1540 RepID=UPI001C0F4526|nr:heavy metal translocating P-type ATPase [Clostridioides mangenotii]MBU5307798.1 cadmium-translocating P-type ATPase [Clostridioides mangenotii]